MEPDSRHQPGDQPEGERGAPDRPSPEARQAYVDRRGAAELQRVRLGGRARSDSPSGGPTSSDEGLWERIRRLFPGGPRHRAVALMGALLLLTATGCGPAADSGSDAPDESASVESPSTVAASPSPTEDDPLAAVCEDEREDLVAFQDGVPTGKAVPDAEGSDVIRATLVQEGDEIELGMHRGAGGPPGSPDARLEVHVQSLDAADDTGVVVLGFPQAPSDPIEIQTGPTTSDLSPVETISSGVGRTSLSATLAVEDLPVAPPLRWYVSVPEGPQGDVCPNVTGFTVEADLPTLTADDGAETADADTLEVTAVDYAFEGVPEQVEAGTRLTLTNRSEQEAHEIALIRMTEDTPPVEEFLRLPMQEGMAVSEMIGVSISLPGERGQVTKGDLLLDEPGRYVLLCAIPVGTPPEQVEQHPYGPPPGAPPPDSPPHLARGMVSVVEVTD